MTRRKLQVFSWSDRLIVAYSMPQAAKLIREQFGSIRGSVIVAATGKVDYCDDEGHVIGSVNANNCGGVWPVPMIVPEL